jgi:hypothetical protein
MSIKTDINAMLLEDVFQIYTQAENKMLEKLSRRVKRGVTETGWNEQKFGDVRKLRKEIEATLGNANRIAKSKLSKGIEAAYLSGVASANKDHHLAKTALDGLVPEHLQRLLLESHNLIDGTSFQILRNTQDAYRDVIAEASTNVLVGTDTRMQTAQASLNKLALKGITGFVDRAGRRWDLASYVEMATRTTSARAALQGHIDRQLAIGNDLVMVSSFSATCPICAPWAGKVLSISGKDARFPSLDSAKAAGLFHPNCKHTITAYFEGMDYQEPNFPYQPERYNAIQRQRYNERQIRKWKRVEAVAMDPASKARAANKISQWQAIQRDHVANWNLRRKYNRESIKNRVANIPKTVEGLEARFASTIGGNAMDQFNDTITTKFMTEGAKQAAYEKWLKKEITSLDGLTLDKKQMSLTEVYKKYIGDTPSQDFKALGITDKTYAKWLKEQVEDIGVGYKIKVEAPPKPPASIVPSTLSPTEKYKKFIGPSPSKDYKDLGITDKSYAKWLKEQSDLAEAKVAGAIPVEAKPKPEVKPKKVDPIASMPDDVSFLKRFFKSDPSKGEEIVATVSKMNPTTKKIIKAYDKAVVVNAYSESGFYSKPTINFNLVGDAKNRRGKYSTFTHEMGHWIDDKVGYLSKTPEFYEAIEADYKDFLKRHDIGRGPITIRRNINNELRDLDDDGGNIVSDIFGGFSDNDYSGKWAHSIEYWNRWDKKQEIASEMFAHLVRSQASPSATKIMKQYFPKAVKAHEKMMEEALKKIAK